MKVIITAAPGPTKLLRRKLYHAVGGITRIDSWPTIRATRDGIGSQLPDLFIAVGRRSPKALGRLSYHLGELGCAQLMCSDLDADCMVYRNGVELPNLLKVPADHSVVDGIVEVTRQFFAAFAKSTEAIARRRVQVGVGREVGKLVQSAVQVPPLKAEPVLAEIRRMAAA